MENKEILEVEANDIRKEIRYLTFTVFVIALFMLTYTLIYSLFR